MTTILHLLASDRYSGAENVALEIIQEMNKEKDFHNIYVSKKGPIEKILKNINIDYCLMNKICIKELCKLNKKYHPEIIHAHDYTMSILATICFPKSKIVSHLHNNSPWIKQYGLYSLIYLLSTVRYSKILTVSKAIENEYVFSKLIKNKIKCIGNPLSTDKILSKANEYQIDKNYDLIFLGRITEPKNPTMVVQIISNLIKKIPNIKIAIVGSGDKEKNLRAEISSLKLEKNITFYGFQENPYPILKNSKVLCMPSKWEGFGLVAFESLALGIPVVCSGVGGLKDIVTNECGKICGFDLESYVREIELLILDKEYYSKKKNIASTRAHSIENSKNYYRKIMETYNMIIYYHGNNE